MAPESHDGAGPDQLDDGPFTVEDLEAVARVVVEAWRSGIASDWSLPAGTLEWSCWATADHTVDCVFSYALFLASRRQLGYPPFDLLRALPEATPADLIEGLEAVARMLSAVITTAPPGTRAVILRDQLGGRHDFAARGALEMVLHGHDVAAGLGVAFDPPDDVCGRLWEQTQRWPRVASSAPPTDDPWSDLLERSGRSRRR